MNRGKCYSTSPRRYGALERYARVELRARMQINGVSHDRSTARRVRPIDRNFLDEPIARRALQNRQ